jgi:hypothetical protein
MESSLNAMKNVSFDHIDQVFNLPRTTGNVYAIYASMHACAYTYAYGVGMHASMHTGHV